MAILRPNQRVEEHFSSTAKEDDGDKMAKTAILVITTSFTDSGATK